METFTTDKLNEIKEKADQVRRDELTDAAKKTLEEAIQNAYATGRFEGLSAVESENLVQSLAAVVMSDAVMDRIQQNARHSRVDFWSLSYHADKAVGAAWNVAMMAAVAGGAVWLAKRSEKSKSVGTATTAPTEDNSTNSQYSDTTPAAFTASPRPSKHGLAI